MESFSGIPTPQPMGQAPARAPGRHDTDTGRRAPRTTESDVGAAADGVRRNPLAPWLLVALVALTVALTYYGFGFYRLGIEARVDHPEFRSLSPSGPVGHGYGIAGTALILTNLLYLLRRRMARWNLGSMRFWLDLHVFTGLFGSTLIVFHSAFQLRSGVATLTAASLALVVLSGVIGRYFYALSPRQDAALLATAVAGVEAVWPALGAHLGRVTERMPPPAPLPRVTLLWSLRFIPRWRSQVAARRRVLRSLREEALKATTLEPHETAFVRSQFKEVERHCVAQVRAHAGENLLKTWRGVHRFTALLMVVSVVVHIGVAVYFGFRWVLSE